MRKVPKQLQQELLWWKWKTLRARMHVQGLTSGNLTEFLKLTLAEAELRMGKIQEITKES